MTYDKQLDDIYELINQIKNEYKNEIRHEQDESKPSIPSNPDFKPRIGDVWYCTDVNKLFICYGIIHGIPKWRGIK